MFRTHLVSSSGDTVWHQVWEPRCLPAVSSEIFWDLCLQVDLRDVIYVSLGIATAETYPYRYAEIISPRSPLIFPSPQYTSSVAATL